MNDDLSPATGPLGGHFYAGPTSEVAQRLLGKLLVRRLSNGQRLSGIIVEVEAYLSGDDPASHSSRGPGRRNASMFLAAGRLYVYSIHNRFCLNVVTEGDGIGSAVLIRALEPLEGLEQQSLLRGVASLPGASTSAQLRSLTTGPGRLCQALGVDKSLDGVELTTGNSIWLEAAPNFVNSIEWSVQTTPRIGISQAQELPLRWFIDGHQLVSGCARDHTRGRHWRFALCRRSLRERSVAKTKQTRVN